MTVTVPAAIAYLRSPQAIRDRCQQLFERCHAGQLDYFACNLERLQAVTAYVIETIQQRYPTLDIPVHSRWRHFEADGVPRLATLYQALAGASPVERARSLLDLVTVSVLLDAGAGSQWRYREAATGCCIGRSEGLAIASLQAFLRGDFSSDAAVPHRVDAARLQQITLADLARIFQVQDDNPLVGLSGRLATLHRLGNLLAAQGGSPQARPGDWLDDWQQRRGTCLRAEDLLMDVLTRLSPLWPGRETIAGIPLGDVWPHPALLSTGAPPEVALVPFHKLPQWLVYSFIEPLTATGWQVTALDSLTGLAEYRNGGLCLDLGLLMPKQASLTQHPHPPGSPVIVEWRALTVILLDYISDHIRQQLPGAAPLSLMQILEGGTWAVGRRIAQQLRPAGDPPITLVSDGTVF